MQWVSPGADDNAASGIVQEGGIPVLFAALKSFMGHERIVQCICLAFFNISVEHCAELMEAGVKPFLKIISKMYKGAKASDQAKMVLERLEIYIKPQEDK